MSVKTPFPVCLSFADKCLVCEFTCGEGGINGKVHLLSAICVKLNETTGEYAVATKSVCMIMLHFLK